MTSSNLNVLTDPAAVLGALEAGFDWAEEISFCTPAISSAGGKWPFWRVLERNGSKLRAAYIALDGMRTEPAALDWLHHQGCLRLIPAADGSARTNAYVFQRGDVVRGIVGAGRLVPAGLMAPLDAVVCWEGDPHDSFAVSIRAALHKAKELAHVPAPEELEDYSAAFYAGADLWDRLDELGAPFIRSTARDVEVPELHLITDERGIRQAQRMAREQLMAVATEERKQLVGFRGGSVTKKVYWCASLKMWSLFEKLENRYWNAFGTSRPDAEKSVHITVEVNPPHSGIDRKMGGAFARDPASGEVYWVHRGRIGGGQKGIGAELFWARFRGGVGMREPEREELARVVVVGKVGSADLPRDVAGFVHEVARIKAAASA